MATITQDGSMADVVKYEIHDLNYSRETVTVKSGQNLAIGTVIGIQDADSKAYVLAPAATDGTEAVAGVLITAADATSADVTGAVFLARHAAVAAANLVWPAGITAPQKVTAIGQLKALGIVLRDVA